VTSDRPRYLAHHDLSRRGIDHSISVFSPGEVFFDDVGDTVRGAIGPLLGEAVITVITVITAKAIAEVGTDHVSFSDGMEVESALSIVIPPYAGPAVLKDSGPLPFQLWGSSAPRHCFTSRFTHSIDQRPA